MTLARPTLVLHADWSTHGKKRWMAGASLQADGTYLAHPAELVGDPVSLLRRLRSRIRLEDILLVGFDFPIGLPGIYQERGAVVDFLSVLPGLGEGLWADFYHVASRPEEIRLHRPFYPLRPGSARQSHLLNALGVRTMNDLRRECELGRRGRRPAAPLFWTLGGQQVGKAAIAGWSQVLAPALRGPEAVDQVSIWPFSGCLADLLQPGASVLAETYPAEYYSHLGLSFSRSLGGKRSQAARMDNAAVLLQWAKTARVKLKPELQTEVELGFGAWQGGEDPFDAVVGLFGMLNLLLGLRPLDEPVGQRLRSVEGWILGQACLPDEADA